MTKHYKQSDFVVVKSFALFYGQVNRLYDVFFTSSTQAVFIASRIEVNGHVPAESGPCPLARSASQVLQGNVCLCKTWLTSRRIDQAQHGLFSNRGCIQRTSIWVPGGAISHFSFFRIRMLFGKNGYDKVRRFYFLETFSFCIFQNYLNVFSFIVIRIMTLAIPKLL